MPTSKLVLVTGATGNQGGAVVQALVKQGNQVRALTRNPTSPAAKRLSEQGVEISRGDFTEHDSLVKAMKGVDAVYAMATPTQSVAIETAQGIAITNATKATGVGHLVYSSVASADRGTGVPHFDSKHEVEKHVLSSGVPYTIIAPVFFMDNLLQPWVTPGLRQGKLAMAMPGTRSLQQIAVADISTSICRRMFTTCSGLYLFVDMIGSPSQVNSLSFHLVQKTPVTSFEWFDNTGYAADIKSLRRDFSEVKWHDFEAWARQQDWSVLDSSG